MAKIIDLIPHLPVESQAALQAIEEEDAAVSRYDAMSPLERLMDGYQLEPGTPMECADGHWWFVVGDE